MESSPGMMAAIATTIPQDGRIEYIFPPEMNLLPFDTGKECQLVSAFQIYEKCLSSIYSYFRILQSVPPATLQVVCSYSFTEEGRVKLVADQLSAPIYSGSFFELRLPGFMSPRSTAPSDSFDFKSFNSKDQILDF